MQTYYEPLSASLQVSATLDGTPAFAPDQRVEAPIAASLRRHIEENETEQDRGLAVVLNWPCAFWRMKLPIRNRHLTGKDERHRLGQET